MSADGADPVALERKVRNEQGFASPHDAATRDDDAVLGVAVLRKPAPTHERTPAGGVAVTSEFMEQPLPRGTLICGPVTTRSQAGDILTDGVGWLTQASGESQEPVPVITGRYYDGQPRLAIIAEMAAAPGDDLVDGGGR